LSDAYIESISRTPRYEFGRHNTYDDMLATMNPEDPFKGDYKPSGKSPKLERSKIPKPKRRDRSEEMDAEERHQRKSEKRKRKKKKDTAAGSSAQNGHTNKGYSKDADYDSTGTFTLEPTDRNRSNSFVDDVRNSVMNLAGPLLKKVNKVKNVSEKSSADDEFNKQEEVDQVRE